MNFHLILFLAFGAVCVGGAINLLAQRHPINSALSLIAVMAALAGEYLLLGAEFVAAVQVIVYAGAIMVLFVFVIMLLNAGEEEHTMGSRVALLLYYLLLSGFLFACGVVGFLIKRNIITIFMSIELMLNGVNLSFVAFAAHWHALAGQVFVFFVMVVAAAEAAVGLAIIISVYRTRETLNVDQVNLLKL